MALHGRPRLHRHQRPSSNNRPAQGDNRPLQRQERQPRRHRATPRELRRLRQGGRRHRERRRPRGNNRTRPVARQPFRLPNRGQAQMGSRRQIQRRSRGLQEDIQPPRLPRRPAAHQTRQATTLQAQSPHRRGAGRQPRNRGGSAKRRVQDHQTLHRVREIVQSPPHRPH